MTLLALAVLMYRSQIFSRPTAVWGLVAAALVAVPSNFGTVGLAFALASLVPSAVFAVLVARRLFASPPLLVHLTMPTAATHRFPSKQPA